VGAVDLVTVASFCILKAAIPESGLFGAVGVRAGAITSAVVVIADTFFVRIYGGGLGWRGWLGNRRHHGGDQQDQNRRADRPRNRGNGQHGGDEQRDEREGAHAQPLSNTIYEYTDLVKLQSPLPKQPTLTHTVGRCATAEGLELLAACRDGCSEAIMLAHGFTIAQMVELVRAGLASATAERVVAGRRTMEIARVRITEAGRRALR
jgi:hypothetical protein